MFKKLFVTLSLLSAVIVAKADFLYWTVADAGDFSLARLMVTGNGLAEATQIGDYYAPDAVGVDGNIVGTSLGAIDMDLGNYSSSGYTFFVELLTYNSLKDSDPASVSAPGYKWGYDELVSSGYVSPRGINTPGYVAVGPLNMGSSVPEPTSGVLLMVGGALLALRRRRRNA